MDITRQMLLDREFKLIGTNSRGLELFARRYSNSSESIVLHKVNKEGYSLGVEHFEKETIKILMNSKLIK